MPVDEIRFILPEGVRPHEHNPLRIGDGSEAIQSTKALSERVEGRALGDEGVEVEVRAGLYALRGDDHNRRIRSAASSPRAHEIRDLPVEVIAIEGPHPPRDKECPLVSALADGPEHLERCRHAVDDDADRPPRRGDSVDSSRALFGEFRAP